MKLSLVDRENYSHQYWAAPQTYSFARNMPLLELNFSDLEHAHSSFPLAAIKPANRWQFVAVCGLNEARNLYVMPDGRWAAPYVPSIIRSHPFYLAHDENGRHVLCFDTDSGLLAASGTAFFAGDSPSPEVQQVIDHLSAMVPRAEQMERALQALDAANLWTEWPVTVQTGIDSVKVEGLYRIDEAALMKLPIDQLAMVRDAGGLQVAFGQIYSIQHLNTLAFLSKQHTQTLAAQTPLQGTLGSGGTIDLSGLQ